MITNFLIPDHQADAFNPPKPLKSNARIVEFLFNGLTSWDGQHFLHVAEHGYLYEHSAAFFPLWPLIIRTLKTYALDRVFPFSGYFCYVASGVLANFVLFNISCIYLVELTLIIFNSNRQVALLTLIFYCLNPANIFFSAVYSECVYATVTFAALYYLYTKRWCLSLSLFFLSGLARSNGSLNSGFVAYLVLRGFFDSSWCQLKKNSKPNYRFLKFLIDILNTLIANSAQTLILFLKLTSTLTFLFAPFAAYQYYIYLRFCKKTYDTATAIPSELVQFAHENQYRLFNESSHSEWCHFRLPLSYSYIQTEYWKVGIFKYWRLKQIPNFLLASPIIYLSVASLRTYLSSMSDRNHLFNLFGLTEKRHGHSRFEKNWTLFPFALHLIVLLVSSLFFMNVQVKKNIELSIF